MTEGTQKIPTGLKAIKVKHPLHRRIDIESATTGVPMYALVAQAWAAYEAAKTAGNPPIPDNLTGTFPLQSKVELPSRAGAAILLIEKALVQLAEISAGALKTVQAVREGLDGGSEGDSDSAEPERARIAELKRRHLGSEAPAKPTGGEKGPDRGRKKRASVNAGIKLRVVPEGISFLRWKCYLAILMKTLLITAATALLLAMSAGTPVVAAAGYGIEPIKPIPPIGCADLVAQCVCETNQACRYVWVCVKKR